MTVRETILKLLSDGRPHRLKEVHGCCGPCSIGTVHVHIHQIRKRLRPNGEDIVCISHGHGTSYQWVRLIGSGE